MYKELVRCPYLQVNIYLPFATAVILLPCFYIHRLSATYTVHAHTLL